MTTLGREVVDAASIVAVTTAFLAAGRGEERATFLPHRHDRTSSRLGLAAGLTAVALLAALAVVVVFWPQRATRDAPLPPAPAATTSGGSREIPRVLPLAPDAHTSVEDPVERSRAAPSGRSPAAGLERLISGAAVGVVSLHG